MQAVGTDSDNPFPAARLRRIRAACRTETGVLPAGTEVRYQLKRHTCRFGLNLHFWGLVDPALQHCIEQAVLALANVVTVPYYWGHSAYASLPPYEPERGRTDCDRLRALTIWALAHGLGVKGHPLVFFREPDWLQDLGPGEQEQAYLQRIRREVGEFEGLIDSWEVVNEPTNWNVTCEANGAGALRAWSQRCGPVEIIRQAHDAARSANPDVEFILNDCDESDAFARIIEGSLDAGVRIDAIGIQHHSIEHLTEPGKLNDMLDRFASFGIPLHITEIMIPSGSDELRRTFEWQPRPEWVSTPEGEARQADEAELLYRRLFAHPAVEAITWWDACDAQACFHIPCGLLRPDGSAKPALGRLTQLIHDEWRTRGESTVGKDGQITWEGFAGEYELHAVVEGQDLRGTATLADGPDPDCTRLRAPKRTHS
jgi:GH35 family endo-1,4-beta-xylanase